MSAKAQHKTRLHRINGTMEDADIVLLVVRHVARASKVFVSCLLGVLVGETVDANTGFGLPKHRAKQYLPHPLSAHVKRLEETVIKQNIALSKRALRR